MVEADRAVEAQFGGGAGKARDCDAVAENVVGPVQSTGSGEMSTRASISRWS